MNKSLIFVSLAFAFLFLSVSLVSAGYYYAPSYSDTYYKRTTYSPFERTTEIHRDSPTNSMYYVKTERHHYGSFYPTYSNSLYSYWKYGPYNYGYYGNYNNYYRYDSRYYDDYGYYRYGF